ncbi:MAG: inositol monophosphatase [Candidatus Delongbacteria bacterium]|nr:inositol monophosphatase [Candidatus Delongbacteria bacterium]
MNKAIIAAMRELLGIVSKTGELLSDGFNRTDLIIHEKAPRDYVTELDLAVERQLVEALRSQFPEWGILAEESGASAGDTPGSEICWIVDPLDGTANFIHGIPHVAISVALARQRSSGFELLGGVVFNPILEQMYSAVRGEGAFLNGVRLRLRPAPPLAESFLATGFPIRWHEVLAQYLPCFSRIALDCGGMRRLGSAALDLCYTAAGNFHGFWEPHLAPWDVAAGGIILQEAGGSVVDFSGGDRFVETGNIIAGDPVLVKALLDIIRQYFS